MIDVRPALRALLTKLDLYYAKQERLKLPKCRVCGRHVRSPCNDADGYQEGGPWDSFCRDYF